MPSIVAGLLRIVKPIHPTKLTILAYTGQMNQPFIQPASQPAMYWHVQSLQAMSKMYSYGQPCSAILTCPAMQTYHSIQLASLQSSQLIQLSSQSCLFSNAQPCPTRPSQPDLSSNALQSQPWPGTLSHIQPANFSHHGVMVTIFHFWNSLQPTRAGHS